MSLRPKTTDNIKWKKLT